LVRQKIDGKFGDDGALAFIECIEMDAFDLNPIARCHSAYLHVTDAVCA
jgi:hypothetical protein